jgi:hypothetical protein
MGCIYSVWRAFFINISNFQTLISSEQEQLTVEQKYNISEQENTMSKNKKQQQQQQQQTKGKQKFRLASPDD